jgi:hypothetical protein
MANTPERLASLDSGAFRARLRQLLIVTYGCWERAQGTGLGAAAWFEALAEAVQAEAQDWQDAMALCRFAYIDEPDVLASDWATEALSRTCCKSVIATAADALRPESLRSIEAANAFWREVRHLLRESDGLRGREVMDVLRAALTGQSRGPCLGIVGALLGPVRTRQRLEEIRECSAPQ